MCEIPSPRHDNYQQWVRANALEAASRVAAGQAGERTHVTVSIARLEKLTTAAEQYLKTGAWPRTDR